MIFLTQYFFKGKMGFLLVFLLTPHRMDQPFLDFLDRVSPVLQGEKFLIPPPKLSSQERKQRRLSYRNERTLYKRASSLSGESIVSFFHGESPLTVYSHDEWWSGAWDPLEYGVAYDFSRDFFSQFHELQLRVPRAPLVNNKAHNSPYCNFADGNRNCHMVTSANWNQDSYYGFCLVSCRDVVDGLWCTDSELLYECSDCRGCYHLIHGRHCQNSSDSAFLYDCIGVKNSLFCVGLRNAEYHIFNKPVSKEEFVNAYNYYICGSHSRLEEAKNLYQAFLTRHQNTRTLFQTSSENVTGNNIWNSHNIIEGYDVYDSQDSSFLHDGLRAKDCSDVCFFDGAELSYESTSLIGYGYRFTNYCRDSYDLFYCDSCYSSKNCFGCIGLRNKEFCIFNVQYTEQEYHDLLPRIIRSMELRGEWGEFFPTSLSLFAYNETLAYSYFPLDKEEILSRGWKWKEFDQLVQSSGPAIIPDLITDISPTFTSMVLSCAQTGKPYKVIPQELRFYQTLRLPVPRLSPDQRQHERMARRNGG